MNEEDVREELRDALEEETPEDLLEEIPEEEDDVSEESPKKKKRTWILILALSLVLLLLVTVGGAFLVFQHFYNKTNYIPDESNTINAELLESLSNATELDPSIEASIEAEIEALRRAAEDLARMSEAPSPETDATLPEMSTQAVADNPGNQVTPVNPGPSPTQYTEYMGNPDGKYENTGQLVPTPNDKVYNLLLVGVDRRAATWNGNSDSMVVLSINYEKKTLTLTSLMRDTQASIPGVGVRKLNNAFAVGGGPLLVNTLWQNFAIPVNNYAWTDFDKMANIIEILGGSDLYLTVKEAAYCSITITEPQVVHLNGVQAVTHARDRSSGGNDYLRTQRQRNVLIAIINKAKSGSLGDLTQVANEILPYIYHNIDQGTLLKLIGDLFSINQYTVQQQRIPYDGWYQGINGNLVPNYAKTQELWRLAVY